MVGGTDQPIWIRKPGGILHQSLPPTFCWWTFCHVLTQKRGKLPFCCSHYSSHWPKSSFHWVQLPLCLPQLSVMYNPSCYTRPKTVGYTCPVFMDKPRNSQRFRRPFTSHHRPRSSSLAPSGGHRPSALGWRSAPAMYWDNGKTFSFWWDIHGIMGYIVLKMVIISYFLYTDIYKDRFNMMFSILLCIYIEISL